MSATQSTMLPLGTRAPAFSLPNVATGDPIKLEDFAASPALLVAFICAHCPYVHHVQPELARIARDYSAEGLATVGITSNDAVEYPEDTPESTARYAKEAGFDFPVLYDETQAIAKAYTAACTPDFFLFDRERNLVYRGQIDESRPNRGTPDGASLRAAVEAVLRGASVSPDQKPSLGCNIKWKPGAAPAYF